MKLTENQIQELKNAGLSNEQLEKRINQVELLDESRTRGFDFWAKYGKVRLYFSISGGNKNRQGVIDLVSGTIKGEGSSMYSAIHQINKDSKFEVI